MKRIISAIAAIFCCVAMSVAQTNFIATLQHDGNFRHFYGQDALTAAYAAAVDGDIITLSPGTFTWSGDFTKGITLRGNGMDAAEKTYISGEVSMYSEGGDKKTVIEGIHFYNTITIYSESSKENGSYGNISFIKDRFSLIETRYRLRSGSNGPEVRIYNSYIVGMHFNTPSDVSVYNSFVGNPISESTIGNCMINFVNCKIQHNSTYLGAGNVHTYIRAAHYLNFYNCIFIPGLDSNQTLLSDNKIPSTSTCYNCLSLKNTNLFADLRAGSNNKYEADPSLVHPDGQLSQLTEDAKSKYIGTDGTEIGIYGGMYPWNNTVQYPTVTTFQPEPKTSKEGILNIQVAVDEE